MSVQRRNAELVDNLRPEFIHRLEPAQAWKSIVSAFMAIPGTLAVWNFAAIRRDSASDRVRDVQVSAYHLSDGNSCYMGYETAALIPYGETVRANNEAFYRVDGGANAWADVTAAESHIVPTQRGLTIIGWFQFTAAAGNFEAFYSKWGNAASRSFRFAREAGGTLLWSISNDGTNPINVATTGIPAQDEWFFAAARFDRTSQDQFVTYNTETVSNATGVNTIFDSGDPVSIGGQWGVGNYSDLRCSIALLSQVFVADFFISALYQQTRRQFGA